MLQNSQEQITNDGKHLCDLMHLTLKAGILHEVLLYQQLYYVHVSILHNRRSCSHALAALLFLYPSVVLVLVNRTGCRQAHHSWMLCQYGYFSPSSSGCLSSKTWTSLDQPAWVAGRSQFAQAEAAWEDRQKAKSTAKLGCFSKGEIITFFPFQEDTCQGSISGKWKDTAVFLGLWSGMITDRKDKCTFSECKGHCQSHRKGGSILPLWEYIKGRREK